MKWVRLVRLGWVIDQGRTLDIASLSMFECDSTCRDNNVARFGVNHKWRESDLSDFEVAFAYRKGKVDTNGESVTVRKRSCETSVPL